MQKYKVKKKKQHGMNYLMLYKEEYPELANQLEQAMNGELPEGWDEEIPVL